MITLAALMAEMSLRSQPASPGGFETETKFDAFECLNPHDRRRDARIESAVPRHAASDADRATEHVRLDDSPGGVLVLLLDVDEIAHALGRIFVGTIQIGFI